MSHFTVLVIGEEPEKQLTPFDENYPILKYLLYTKEELIENEREYLKKYNETFYQEYLWNTEKYIQKNRNKKHIHYLKEIFPKLLNLSDKELHAHTLKTYEPDLIGSKGEVYSHGNPKAKWDWYQLGGRWKGYFLLKDGSTSDVALKKGLKTPLAPTFAVLQNGIWSEQGNMGWWGMVSNAKSDEDWQKKFNSTIDSLPEHTLLSLYDCHI